MVFRVEEEIDILASLNLLGNGALALILFIVRNTYAYTRGTHVTLWLPQIEEA